MSIICVGTSGWNYSHWSKGVFYPQGLSQKKWLQFYADRFNGVEINVTFYRSVNKEAFSNWKNETTPQFLFVVKGPRFITHIKRLQVEKESLARFFESIKGLDRKLAAVLWQLPPNYKKNLNKLGAFISAIKKRKVHHVFEFRHESWFDEDTYSLLKDNNACLCIAHSGQRYPCIKEVTADFLYLRFHGGGSLYSSNYSAKELKEWAAFAKGYKKKKDIFAFFNNDAYGYAVRNAARFRELVGT